MEGARKDDDIGTFGVGPGNLNRVFVCLGTRIGKKGFFVLTADGRELTQLFGERHIPFVGDDIKHGVEIPLGLRLNGLDNFRVRITDIEHTNPANPVQKPIAVHIFDDGTRAALDDGRIHTPDGVGDNRMATFQNALRLGARQGFGDNFGQCFS